MQQTNSHYGERWKDVQFDFEFTNDYRLQVSNYGRLRTFNKVSDGNIINGSMINGYRIIRLKFFKLRDEKLQNRLEALQKQVFKMAKILKAQKENKESKKMIAETSALLDDMKKKLSKKFKDDEKNRTIHYHSLVHRLVATYFLKAPTALQTIVAHLDYDKLNNRSNNLKWMKPEVNYKHQQGSPFVMEEKIERHHRRKENSKATKLSVTKVMLMKKLLNQYKPIKQLAKQFKVTETQIYRIKRGENWGEVEAAT